MGKVVRAGLLAATALVAAACSPPAPQPAASAANRSRPPPALVESDDSEWIATWGAAVGSTHVARDSRYRKIKFRDITIRQVVRISAGGEAVRLRLSNEFGKTPLKVGAASLALVDGNGAVIEASARPLSFGGKPSATIPAGAPLLSDPVALRVEDLANLSISLYLPERSQSCSCHETALATSELSPPGDYTATTFEPLRTTRSRAFISGVEVLAPSPAGAIAIIGDSLTDGMGSTINANHRWPDFLAERLVSYSSGATMAVVNAGVSGNRLLDSSDNPSALSRFDRDVLARPGVTHVIVFLGVNDLGVGLRGDRVRLSVNDMIVGYRQLIARARANKLKIYGATIAPYRGAEFYWSERGEAARQTVNAWIRSSGEFDAVLDFAAVLADPADSTRMADGFHSGDYLHGSDAGYRAIASTIDLALFESAGSR